MLLLRLLSISIVIATLHQLAPIKKFVYTITGETTTVLIPEGCGIKIFVPQGVVPPGVSCNVAVIPVAAGYFVFPSGYKPVSCVYAIGVSCDLLKPVTIDMEHCVVVTENRSLLSFASAEHDKLSPPYEFKKCTNTGRFVAGSSYGSVDCQSFTLYTMLMRVASWFISIPEERYKVSLLYKKSKITPRKWTVHFIVTKNLNDHLQVSECSLLCTLLHAVYFWTLLILFILLTDGFNSISVTVIHDMIIDV